MKIEGNTVIFKSYLWNYDDEESGLKPCTVRMLSGTEWDAFCEFGQLAPVRDPEKRKRLIRIVDADDPERYFEREITYCSTIGELLYNQIVLICWENPE